MNYFKQESERLLYRKTNENDIESWADFFEENKRLEFLPIDSSKDKEVLAKEWILKQIKKYNNNEFGMLSVIRKFDNKLIGMGGILIHEIEEKKEYEIAYSIKPRYWGKGYATEIAKQIKNYAIKQKITSRLISIIDKENKASIRVAEKNGMKLKSEQTCFGLNVYIYEIKID